MKRLSKYILISLVIILLALVLFPIITYSTIVITNNYLADQIEKDLVEFEVPEQTTLLDSVSLAGKLSGNGNGMQYMGAVLVNSNLGAEELKAHYSGGFEYIEVKEQKSEKIDFVNSNLYSFDYNIEDVQGTYYSIYCYDFDRREALGGFIGELLDMDVRGH